MGNECSSETCITTIISREPSKHNHKMNPTYSNQQESREAPEKSQFNFMKNAAYLCTNFDNTEDLQENKGDTIVIRRGNHPCPPGKFTDQKLKQENYEEMTNSARKRKFLKSESKKQKNVLNRKINNGTIKRKSLSTINQRANSNMHLPFSSAKKENLQTHNTQRNNLFKVNEINYQSNSHLGADISPISLSKTFKTRQLAGKSKSDYHFMDSPDISAQTPSPLLIPNLQSFDNSERQINRTYQTNMTLTSDDLLANLAPDVVHEVQMRY